jgi:hypothetical protein
MKHKILRLNALMLITAMLLTLVGANVAFAASVDYAASLAKVHKLGIISASATNKNAVVTRADFLKSIIASEGMNNVAAGSKGTTEFSDITPKSALSGYINAGLSIGTAQGVNEGVVYGTSNGTYKPNNAVTYADACTVLVRLLGYSDTDSDLEKASYPNNYIQEAAKLGLSTGLSLSKSSKLTVGAEAVLFDRLFDSEMKSSSGAATSYFSDNYYGNTTTVSGTLTEVMVLGNSKTSDNLASNKILTDAGTLTMKSGVAMPQLGGKYRLYIDGSTVTKVLTEDNTVQSYTVKSISKSNVLTYTQSGKNKTLALPKISEYYYHGAYVDYNTAVSSIYAASTVILAKNSSGGYDYGLIVDPYTGDTVVSGALTEAMILGNSKTSDSLSSNQILTNIGTLTVKAGVTVPQLGGTYELYVDGSTVTKAVAEENSVGSYTAQSIPVNNAITYTQNGKKATLTLPAGIDYYYHGKIISSDTAVSSIYASSSVVLAKSMKGSYQYGVIVDPYTGNAAVSGTLTEAMILGNSKTSDNLADNKVLTDIGTLTVGAGVAAPQLGGKYKLYVNNSTITKIVAEENAVESYTAQSIPTGNVIAYTVNNVSKTMTLPQAAAYYYHGAYVSYDTAVSSIYASSSVILAKDSSGNYAYGIIVDPYTNDDIVSGTLTEMTVLENSKTAISDDLADNQIKTDTGTTLTLASGVATPEIGGKYKIYLDGTTVTKIVFQENALEDYAVKSKSSISNIISYTDDQNASKTMTLPQASYFYYDGKCVDYATAVNKVQPYSSIVLSKNRDGTGYDFGIIIDPIYGQPYVYKLEDSDLLNKLNTTKYDFIYRDLVDSYSAKVGNIAASDLEKYDVLYFVSDIWGKNTFIYVYDKTVGGVISAFTPDKADPTGVTVNGTSYSFNPYFDKISLNNYDGDLGNFLTNTGVGDYRELVLGIDGTVVDMYAP